MSYVVYDMNAVNKSAQEEFGKDADIVYSSYTSPGNITIFYGGKY